MESLQHAKAPYRYVLMTPARNEEENIEGLLKSVAAQTILPAKWVIADDGSTDRTAEIIRSYANVYQWITLHSMPEHRDRHFAAKADCIKAAYELIKSEEYEILGNLDADITFQCDYIEMILSKFAEWPELGVAGTPFIEEGFTSYNHQFTNFDHVSGACQFFRKQCFIDVGGYIPIKSGGIDWAAVTTARMKGWKTRTFNDRSCFHHRKMGTGNASPLKALFKHGQKDFSLGGHPVWQFFRASYRMLKRPYIIGGLLLFTGYLWGFMSGRGIAVSKELKNFHRKEQMNRLKNILFSRKK